VAYGGLQVNGNRLHATYNVAVGGTDFYYSQYAGSSSPSSRSWGTLLVHHFHHLARHLAPQDHSRTGWNDFFGFNLYDTAIPPTSPAN